MHTKRQWMVTHEWMVKPMAQTEWIEGQGLLIWMAEVFSALGMGLYLVSLFLNNWWGMLAGWLIIIALKLPFHFFYLGKPWRFWRAIPPFTDAWRTSWIARGMFFTTAFAAFAFVQLVTSYLLAHGMVDGSVATLVTVIDWAARIIAGLFSLLTGIYCGFMMSFCKSVPFWNTGLLPIVFVIMGIGLVAGGVDFHNIETASRWALVVNALLIGTYLINASYQSTTAEVSVKQLVVGKVAAAFWVGVVLLGIFVPLLISLISLFAGEASPPLLIVAIICHTVGAFALKYCVLKVGIYRPILSRVAAY